MAVQLFRWEVVLQRADFETLAANVAQSPLQMPRKVIAPVGQDDVSGFEFVSLLIPKVARRK